jgi:hypothetical protein
MQGEDHQATQNHPNADSTGSFHGSGELAAERLRAEPPRLRCTEAIMFAHGFTIDMLVELVRAGLATATSERVVAGGRTIEVARVRIDTLSTRTDFDPAKFE